MYYVLVVKNSSPSTLEFKNELDVTKYLENFAKKYGSLDDKNSNWIEHVFKGKKLKPKITFTLSKS